MRPIILLAIALAAAPAAATPASGAGAVQSSHPDIGAEDGAAELQAFLTWLVELERRNAPGNEAFGELRGAWQEALASGGGMASAAAVRPVVMRTIAALDAVHANLGTMPAPDFPRLALHTDVSASAMIAVFRQSNRELRAAAEGFLPVLEAMARRDRNATDAALDRLMGTARSIIASQRAILRARLAVVPREESAWDVTNQRLLAAEASMRVTASWPAVRAARADPSLAADLVSLADQLDANAAAGAAKVEAEFVAETAALRRAESGGDAAAASILRPLVASLGVNRRIFAPSRTLAAAFRAQATQLRGPVTLQSFRALNGAIRSAVAEIEQIMDEELAAMAAAGG